MSNKHIIFAGGGTGGHIYPAIAIAEKITQFYPQTQITFFCSERPVDRNILSKTSYNFIQLPAVGFGLKPVQLYRFYTRAKSSTKIVNEYFDNIENPEIISIGGFVSAPVVCAANKRNIPIHILNTDITPGKANKLFARYAKKIFVQFPETVSRFSRHKDKVIVTGCPLRRNFSVTDKQKTIDEIGIDPSKKVLLVTGASSGAANINNAMALLIDKLAAYSETWQVVHLAGRVHKHVMNESYQSTKMKFIVLDYYEQMANLLACSDLLIGRAGAVSVAEYIASGVPAICMPYPYHRDNHQLKNAKELVKYGCGIIVEDRKDAQQNAKNLWPNLKKLLDDNELRKQMRENAQKIAKFDAGYIIAKTVVEQIEDDLVEDQQKSQN